MVIGRRDSGKDNTFWTNIDLSNTKLQGAFLHRADLESVILENADLTGVDLRGAILVDANLRGAIMRGADFFNSRLRNCNLSNADLREAIDLSESELCLAESLNNTRFDPDIKETLESCCPDKLSQD